MRWKKPAAVLAAALCGILIIQFSSRAASLTCGASGRSTEPENSDGHNVLQKVAGWFHQDEDEAPPVKSATATKHRQLAASAAGATPKSGRTFYRVVGGRQSSRSAATPTADPAPAYLVDRRNAETAPPAVPAKKVASKPAAPKPSGTPAIEPDRVAEHPARPVSTSSARTVEKVETRPTVAEPTVAKPAVVKQPAEALSRPTVTPIPVASRPRAADAPPAAPTVAQRHNRSETRVAKPGKDSVPPPPVPAVSPKALAGTEGRIDPKMYGGSETARTVKATADAPRATPRPASPASVIIEPKTQSPITAAATPSTSGTDTSTSVPRQGAPEPSAPLRSSPAAPAPKTKPVPQTVESIAVVPGPVDDFRSASAVGPKSTRRPAAPKASPIAPPPAVSSAPASVMSAPLPSVTPSQPTPSGLGSLSAPAAIPSPSAQVSSTAPPAPAARAKPDAAGANEPFGVPLALAATKVPAPAGAATDAQSSFADPQTGKPLQAPAPAQHAPRLPYDEREAIRACNVMMYGAIEQDHQRAIALLASMVDWPRCPLAGRALRKIAATDYNTEMRRRAVVMLGLVRTEPAETAEVLQMSARFDSDPGIRATALWQLERLAALPPHAFRR